jgi:hypothetical protein
MEEIRMERIHEDIVACYLYTITSNSAIFGDDFT